MTKSCRKRRHHDHIAAKLALAEIVRKGKTGKDQRRAYFCPKCAGWHLTSQSPRVA